MRKFKMQLFYYLSSSWIILLVCLAFCVDGGKVKVTINKCCRLGDHLTSDKSCGAGGGFEKWAPKVYFVAKKGYFNRTGELPPFMKADEESFPKTCNNYELFTGPSNIIIMNNGSLYINSKDVMIPPEDYCVEKDAALVCFHQNNMTDPESLTESRQATKISKCCGPRQAYNEHNSTPCANLDKNHELFSAKIIQGNVDISYSFPECQTNDYAIAGAFIPSNFDAITGDVKTVSGQLFKPHQFCLDNMLGDVQGIHIFTCSEHYKEVAVHPSNDASSQDLRFFIYSIGLIISVVFLIATLAVGFLVQSNHHLLHWRCQTNYVCCLLIGDLLLAITQMAGNSIAGFPCIFIGELLLLMYLIW